MRDTVGAKLFVCVLVGVLSMLTIDSAALADRKEASKNNEFRGSVTATGEIKDHQGNLVGKVEMDSKDQAFDLAKMSIREDGAVTNNDGKIMGHLVVNFDKPVKGSKQKSPSASAAPVASRSVPAASKPASAAIPLVPAPQANNGLVKPPSAPIESPPSALRTPQSPAMAPQSARSIWTIPASTVTQPSAPVVAPQPTAPSAQATGTASGAASGAARASNEQNPEHSVHIEAPPLRGPLPERQNPVDTATQPPAADSADTF